jgi:hypothetical protein
MTNTPRELHSPAHTSLRKIPRLAIPYNAKPAGDLAARELTMTLNLRVEPQLSRGREKDIKTHPLCTKKGERKRSLGNCHPTNHHDPLPFLFFHQRLQDLEQRPLCRKFEQFKNSLPEKPEATTW